MPAVRGTRLGASEVSASTMPTTSAANSAADGTPTRVSGTVTATVTAISKTHLSISRIHVMLIPSMPLLIAHCNMR